MHGGRHGAGGFISWGRIACDVSCRGCEEVYEDLEVDRYCQNDDLHLSSDADRDVRLGWRTAHGRVVYSKVCACPGVSSVS